MTFQSLGQAGKFFFFFSYSHTTAFLYINNTNKIKLLARLDISGLTVQRVLAENNVHGRKPTEKTTLSPEQAASRLAFCLEHRGRNWRKVIFTDKSYFETGGLRR